MKLLSSIKADKQFWIIATIIFVLIVVVSVSIIFITKWSSMSHFLGLVAEENTQNIPTIIGN